MLKYLHRKHCTCRTIGKRHTALLVYLQETITADVCTAVIDIHLTHHVSIRHVAAAKVYHQRALSDMRTCFFPQQSRKRA
ncbi:hypothetical protein MesoLjLa_50030 [Mesorhizobium sp. L-2-11]|nr:hypothetical protein MesoLjLa_50030 [Mesorhizobium sp. L-2-11]